MHRAGKRAGLEHPDHVDAAALQVAAHPQAGPADQHHHVAVIAAGAQRLDEHAHLLDTEADGRAEHEAARIGGRGTVATKSPSDGEAAAGDDGDAVLTTNPLSLRRRRPRQAQRLCGSLTGLPCGMQSLGNGRQSRECLIPAAARRKSATNPVQLISKRAPMPGSGTDHTKEWTAIAGADRRAGRAAARREHRDRGPRHGEFRADPAAAGPAPRRLAQRPCPARGIGRRRRCSTAPSCSTPCAAALADCSFVLATTARAHDQAKPVIGPAEAARADGAAPRLPATRSRWCSGASAGASKTTRSGSPTAS